MTHLNITPLPELVQEWWAEALKTPSENAFEFLATRAAQWGADQELEACCVLIEQKGFLPSSLFRLHRRPKPPSLKEQALEALERQCLRSISPLVSTSDLDTIRRALEALDD
jgi:hypothetical protein